MVDLSSIKARLSIGTDTLCRNATLLWRLGETEPLLVIQAHLHSCYTRARIGIAFLIRSHFLIPTYVCTCDCVQNLFTYKVFKYPAFKLLSILTSPSYRTMYFLRLVRLFCLSLSFFLPFFFAPSNFLTFLKLLLLHYAAYNISRGMRRAATLSCYVAT